MKETFVKSTFILLIGGFLTKLLGMIIKIEMARKIGAEGLGLYMMILPTFSLVISISQFGFPIALAKLISEEKRNNKKLFFSILPLSIGINLFMMIIIIFLSPFISKTLLQNKNTYLSILAISLVIPFTSISSICRSYFFGKNRMIPHVISNLVEDIIRLGIMELFVQKVTPFGLKYAVCFIVLSNIISEISSTIILLLFLPKNSKITKEDLKPNKTYMKDSLRISIPTTTNRLIASIGFFLEPIILTNTLKRSYSLKYITTEYGIITGYVLPLILLPSFFTLAISQALLPIISKEYSNKNYKTIKRKITQAIILSLLIGLPATILLVSTPNTFLNLLYHTNKGINYICFLAPICLLQYIQSPLSMSLDAMGKSKDNLSITIIGTLTRTILLFLLSNLKIGLWSLMISISTNILITTFLQIQKVSQSIKKIS